MNNFFFRVIPIFFFSLFVLQFGGANASTAYTIDGYNDLTGIQTLYSINTDTGVVAAIGTTGYRISDIAWDRTSGQLYGAAKTRSSSGTNGLVKINTTTGVATLVDTWKNSTGGSAFHQLTQIDIDSNGKMYGSDKAGQLLEIDSSNAVVSSAEFHTVIAEDSSTALVGLGRYGLSFDGSDTLWRNIGTSNQYVTTDVTTNVTSPITATPNSNGFGHVLKGGIDLEKIIIQAEFNGQIFPVEVEGRHGSFDLSTGLFWVLNGETISMYDMTTGDIVDSLALTNVLVVANPFSVNQGIRGLAFAPVPVPAALWLFGPALFCLLGFSKKPEKFR